MEEQEIPVKIFDDDPNVYLHVYNMGWHWYYYNPDNPPLGDGAMGRVYLGYDYTTNQKVAIKQLFDRYSNSKTIRERADLEASFKFRHPNMVEMLGICKYQDEEEDWHVWIISNFVDGETIDKHVKLLDTEGEDIVPVIASEICDILEALDYLHSKGIVHRDIKPSNIMVSSDRVPRLMDLGIARVTGSNSYTSMGFVGTPLYASPEQILRDKMQVQATPASDIYSLGMTLYVLINGSNPFNADTEARILANQVTKKLPPAENLPKRYRKLMNVIWKATEKDPENRYQSAMEFSSAIKNALLDKKTSPWVYFLTFGLALILIITIIAIMM